MWKVTDLTSVDVLKEMGEETDGVITSVSKLQSKIKALSGVNILTESGDYKDTYTILKEIGQVWEDMNDIDQAALLELMAGGANFASMHRNVHKEHI